MIRAILFDMGGTLDGDGRHWLDRFWELYAAHGVVADRAAIRSAFDAAERRAGTDDDLAAAGLVDMVTRHLDWQFAHLGLAVDLGLRDRMVADFVDPMWAAAAVNARLLEALHASGLTLGVVSNGVGNVDTLCREMGYAPFLSVVVDSRRVGVSKPDPAIYRLAAERTGVGPEETLMVGDSFERDVQPARAVGMRTAWLQGTPGRLCPDPAGVDVCLRALTDLPDALRSLEWLPA